MERKINDQKKLIDFLYDDLESNHIELDALQESLKQAKDQCRRNLASAENAKKELSEVKRELSSKDGEEKRIVCDKGCGKYNKSVDEIYEAAKSIRKH